MAGYDGFSKSNNARDAESSDRFPASVLAKKLSVKAGAIKALMVPTEWHHSSKFFNSVDYYDGELLLQAAANEPDLTDCYGEEETASAVDLLATLRAWTPPAAKAMRWSGCTVRWLEWGGTRARPKATEREETGCTVDWKGGAMCVVTFANVSTMRKKTTTNGFTVRDNCGDLLHFLR